MIDPAAMRRAYGRDVLDESTAPDSWLELFAAWFEDAAGRLRQAEVNAMQVATVDAGRPSVRTVLLKGYSADGLEFYTNYDSDKGLQLAAVPYAAAVLAWVPLERQVRVSGPVRRVDRARTEAYFATRPRGSQIGAWASPQSQVVVSRAELDRRQREVEERFADGPVPAPPNWGGYLVQPEVVEFWQGRADRLHDRLRYAGGRIERLAP